MTALKVDKEGFLRNRADWTPDAAAELAAAEGIALTSDHWHIINVVRDYYATYHISPATRVLVNIVKRELGSDKGQSIYLMTLFSGKPAKLVSKIAGLPKPANCD